MLRTTNALLVGTRKGAFVLRRGTGGRFAVSAPVELGTQVNDFQQDPREPAHLVYTSGGGGHLGPTVRCSRDGGATWSEATRPPAFHPLLKEGDPVRTGGTTRGLAVERNFWLTPGHVSERGTWYLGTVPQGLFKSTDHGATWTGVDGFNLNANHSRWTFEAEVPDGPYLHSVIVDARDARHLWLSMSVGGTFESKDGGATWAPINAGVRVDFGPDKYPEFGQDPHCAIQHPADPNLLYQQNHCGIYRLDLSTGRTWTRIGDNMPREIGDIGFGIAGHPKKPGTVWVVPMDAREIWPRTSPGGQPAVYRTDDHGASWKRLANGLPTANAYMTSKRQALCVLGASDAPAICFGLTCGEVWLGHDGGERFECIARHLPEVLSLRAAVIES
jgi:photosystem II stability/assembly factor-like uncharacterized protein